MAAPRLLAVIRLSRGRRANHTGSRCWDGQNLDSPDHKSHVAYGQGSGATGGGACPSTHPVKLPQVMYELMWDVSGFADKSIWPTSGPALVYSMNLGYVHSPRDRARMLPNQCVNLLVARPPTVTMSSAGRATVCKRPWTTAAT